MPIRNFQPAMSSIVALGGEGDGLRDSGHRFIKNSFAYAAAFGLDEPPQCRSDLLHP